MPRALAAFGCHADDNAYGYVYPTYSRKGLLVALCNRRNSFYANSNSPSTIICTSMSGLYSYIPQLKEARALHRILSIHVTRTLLHTPLFNYA